MKKILFLLLIPSLLSGCVEEKIIDDINIISAVGYDKVEGDQVMGTAIIPVYKADKSISNESFTAIAKQSKAIDRKIQQKSADPMESGSIEVVLFGKEFAEEGVIEITDTLERDSSIGSNLFLAVVDGKAREVLESDLGNLGTGSYLSTLFEHNMTRRELPLSNLHLFLYAYYSKVKDAALPYVKLEGNKVNIKGVALFDENKVVSYLDDADMFFFKALMENFKNGSYTFTIEDEFVTTYSLTLERKYTIEQALSDPLVNVKVKLKGHIREFSGEKIDTKMIKKIEKRFEEIINEKTETLLSKFKELQIDPVGIGLLAKTQTRNFDEEKWNEVYEKATFNVSSEVHISETGVVE
jgi:spore germination protein